MSMTKTMMMGLIAQIEEADLMTDELKEFMLTNLVDGTAASKAKRRTVKKDGEPRAGNEEHKSLVSKCLYYIRDEVFKGVVAHKYCLGAAQSMAKLITENSDLSDLDACNMVARRVNENKGEVIFPLDKKTFSKMEKLMKEKKAMPSRSNSSAGSESGRSETSLTSKSSKKASIAEGIEEKPKTVKKIVDKIEKSKEPKSKSKESKKVSTVKASSSTKPKPKPISDDDENSEMEDADEEVEESEVEESSEDEDAEDEEEAVDWTRKGSK